MICLVGGALTPPGYTPGSLIPGRLYIRPGIFVWAGVARGGGAQAPITSLSQVYTSQRNISDYPAEHLGYLPAIYITIM